MPIFTKKKLFNRYLPMALSVALLVAAWLFYDVQKPETPEAKATWYSGTGTWNYRKLFTIDHTKVDTTSGSSPLVNFPILVKRTADADIKYTGSGGNVAISN